MTKNLIHITSKTKTMINCDCCDENTKSVDNWYKEKLSSTSLGNQTYLDCCYQKVGIVVGWYEDEEFHKPIGKAINGVTPIKGYVE